MKELGKHVVDFGEALNKDLNSLARSAKDGFHNIADTLFASQLVPAGGPNIQRMSIPDPPQTTHTKVTPERQRQIDALKNGEYSGRVNKANADDINDVYGPYYDEAKKLHEANPEWYPNPDESTILQGKELKKAREEYEALVRRGELEKGHHVQGLSFGGKNKHTEVTVFQNKVLKWQRDTGRRQKNKTRKKGTKRKK